MASPIRWATAMISDRLLGRGSDRLLGRGVLGASLSLVASIPIGDFPISVEQC